MFVLDDVVTVVVLEVVDVMFVSVQSDVIMVVVKFGGERVEYVKFQATGEFASAGSAKIQCKHYRPASVHLVVKIGNK